MAQKLLFDVKGMTCDHCVRSVTNAVKEVRGVRSAEVSLENNTAAVEGDALDVQAIVAAIEEEGYEAALRS